MLKNLKLVSYTAGPETWKKRPDMSSKATKIQAQSLSLAGPGRMRRGARL